MTVVYYTEPYFLDAAIETIQCIKNKVALHLVIELSPESKKSTIIDIKTLDGLKAIESGEQVLGEEKWKQLEKYFEGIASVQFVVFNQKKAFSPANLPTAFTLGKYIKSIHADIVHFDTVTARSIGLYPYLRSKKVFITIHDPVRHSGEESWKSNIPLKIFSRLAKGYFFYSNFAASQFTANYLTSTVAQHVIKFQPFSFIKQLIKNNLAKDQYILFFGRVSLYKGIDLLLDAIPKVLTKYPDEKFIIAGKPEDDYLPPPVAEQYKNNIQYISDYLTIEALAQYIACSKFIVCPYRDATQSGVLMTSFALGKTVVATNVGAFPEYIKNNISGLLTTPDADGIADKILEALNNEKYRQLENNVTSQYSEETAKYNQACILNAYKNSLAQHALILKPAIDGSQH